MEESGIVLVVGAFSDEHARAYLKNIRWQPASAVVVPLPKKAEPEPQKLIAQGRFPTGL